MASTLLSFTIEFSVYLELDRTGGLDELVAAARQFKALTGTS